MKEIPLTKGYVAIVDDEDYARLTTLRWQAFEKRLRQTGVLVYAHRKEGSRGHRRSVFMHRLVMEAGPGIEVDHISGDTLDNRKSNLRLADRRGNTHNRRKCHRVGGRPTSSLYKGVCLYKRTGKWGAMIRHPATGKRLFLGSFATEEEAARAYDQAAHRLFGAFAKPNFPVIERSP